RPRRRRVPAADLHEDGAGPADAVLRSDRAARGSRLRRRQLQGAVRGDRARTGTPRQPLGRPMTPQRRSALVSVAAAAALVVLKLSVGLATHSLGLISEAAHSGTDLVAALLTFFAIRVAARPADVTHQFGHGKAEHLSALAEAGFLVLVSLFISLRALERLWGASNTHVSVTWYALVVVVVVLVIHSTRTIVSFRTSR